MIQKIITLILYFFDKIPLALGEFMPLCLGGAALLFLTLLAKKFLKGRL